MKFPGPKDVTNWIDERTPLLKIFKEFLHEDIPGGARYSYTLGSACMFLLTIQIVTGIWQLFYFVPTTDYAYNSVNYLRTEVPWGWLVHGLHYWGANAFTVVVGLHMIRVFVWGSYKKPRELVWLFGLVLLVLTALFMFTGPVLYWDKKGYWAGQVGIGIAGSVPIIGPFTQLLLQGASHMGQSALLRMYVMHVALIPFLTGLFVFLHLMAFRQFGEAGPWKESERKKPAGTFWPEQIFKDIVVAILLFIMLVGLTAFYPPEFSGLADPSDTLYTPKPIWNFLFLYQILKWLPGPLEALGTVGVPTLILVSFASLPFLDKNPERNPFKRVFVIGTFFVFIAVVLWLTWLGNIYKSDAELAHTETSEPAKFNENHTPMIPSKHELKKVMEAANKDNKITGERLFNTLGCSECHAITGGASNKIGPDLLMAQSNNRTAEWMHAQIVAPESHNQRTIMPPYSHLNNHNVDLLVKYLAGLKPKAKPAPKVQPPAAAGAAVDTALVSIQSGEELFNTQGCTQCHTVTGRKSNKAGPDLIMATTTRKPTAEWLKTQLTAPQQHNPISIMPSYATRLNEAQITDLINYLKSLEGKLPTPLAAGESAAAESDKGQSVSAKPMFGASVDIIGDKVHGAILFHQSCTMCHGPHGNTKAKGFKAPSGVPTLNPIRQELYSADARTFAQRIDVFIQHGAPALAKDGPAMPNFGDSNTLTQAQIADIEAYVLDLNNVDRTKITNPGIEPKEFFFILLGLTFVVLCLSGLYWYILKFLKI